METFETQACTRCGGSGHYSYCLSHGTTCFKCSGSGRTYTKRGAAAKIYFENLLSIPAKDIVPGMKVKALIISADGRMTGNIWSLVERIEDNSVTKKAGTRDNVTQEYVYTGLNLITVRMDFVAVNPEALYRVAATAEQKRAALAKALDYQATLTKAGKPRKNASR